MNKPKHESAGAQNSFNRYNSATVIVGQNTAMKIISRNCAKKNSNKQQNTQQISAGPIEVPTQPTQKQK